METATMSEFCPFCSRFFARVYDLYRHCATEHIGSVHYYIEEGDKIIWNSDYK